MIINFLYNSLVMANFLEQIFTRKVVLFLIIVFAVGFIIGLIGVYWLDMEKGLII